MSSAHAAGDIDIRPASYSDSHVNLQVKGLPKWLVTIDQAEQLMLQISRYLINREYDKEHNE